MTFIAAGTSLAATIGLTGLVGATAGGIIGTGLVAGAAGAGLGAITSAATGQDIGKGALMGGVTGLVGGGALSGLSGLGAGTMVAGGLAGAAGGAAGSAAGGEDVGKGALLGGALGAASGALEGVGNAAAEDAIAAKGLAGQASGADMVSKAASTDISGMAHAPTDFTIPTSKYLSTSPIGVGSSGGSSGLAGFNEVMGNAPAISTASVPTIPSTMAVAPTAAKSSSILPEFITDNPKTSMAAGAGGLYYLMSQGNKGTTADQASATSIYDPVPYAQTAIPKTTVPQYYPYAEGGSVTPQPQQASQPMNKFAQIGLQMAQQRVVAQQAQQPQAPAVGIPMQQPQPQQTFADGGFVLPANGKHDDFMQQVQSAVAQQLSQNLPVQPVAPVAPPVQQPVQPIPQTQPVQKAAVGGIMQDNLGGYSHGGIAGLTRGPGDGVSDSIPAEIGDSGKQPARLADGEFVIPARIVSELGNGSTEAGAKSLQAMVDRVQKRRSKTVGKGKVAVDSKARKGLLA
jgi:hypothetical protein